MRTSLFLLLIFAVFVCFAGQISAQERPRVPQNAVPEIGSIEEIISFMDRTILSKHKATFDDGTQTYTISGRAMLADGRPIYGANIRLTDFITFDRSAITSPFGYFQIPNVPPGDLYALSVSHRLYLFSSPTLLIEVNSDMNGILMLGELPY